MNMTKAQLVELIESVGITARENELYLEDLKTFPKIAYWEYIIEDVMASGDNYETVVTYQVSFASRTARPPELIRLKRAFNDAGYHPVIYHETLNATNGPAWHHYYFRVEITEDMGDGSGT
jgi:hypothetical protein